VINDQLADNFYAPSGQPLNFREAERAAEHSIRRNSKTFFFATVLLPQPKRSAIRALYAFCRASDDLVDVLGASEAEVERWQAQVSLPPEKQADPVLYLWALTRAEYGVNQHYQAKLMNGVASDVLPAAYQTWKQLRQYCYQVASTVGLMSIPIIGLRKGVTFEQAAPYAITLGIALQLTNILRDVGEDAQRGKVYLPEEELQRFGLSRADILNGVQDERFVALMKFEIRRARRLYRQALPGIALLSFSGQAAVGAAALLYRAILDEIEAICYAVYQQRAHTSGGKKLAMLPGILATVLSLHPPVLR
jgi:phytoene synthase